MSRHIVAVDKAVLWPIAMGKLDSKRAFVFFMIVPKEIVVNVRNKAFAGSAFSPVVVLVAVELNLEATDMRFGHAHRPQETPCYSIEVIAVKGVLLVAIQKCLRVKIEQLK